MADKSNKTNKGKTRNSTEAPPKPKPTGSRASSSARKRATQTGATRTAKPTSTGKSTSSVKKASSETGSKPTTSKPKGKPADKGRAPRQRASQAKRPVQKGKPGTARKTPAPAVDAPPPPAKPAAPPEPKIVEVPEAITVRDLSGLMGVSPIDIIKELMNNGIMANINQLIDFDTAAIVGEEMGFEIREEKPEIEEEAKAEAVVPLWRRLYEDEDPKDLQPRPPVVTVMGHVDHGKTSLLDVIRNTKVVANEAGGITQHIGAYQVEAAGKKITFLDTPGHEAFTAMRARGAQATDVAILVVAADDGVMPQTREALDHARAAQVPVVIALNKMDKPEANPDLVKQQLADLELTCEEWGGDTICVPVSAKKQTGIQELLENILLVTEVEELKANPNRSAQGTVVEGQLDKTRGPMATLLVQNGTLRVGDILVVGETHGRVKAMFDDKGKNVEEAAPSTPVAVLGLSDVPRAGDTFYIASTEKEARAATAERIAALREAATEPTRRALSLDDVYEQIRSGKVKQLNLILKADAQGSLEPILNSLGELGDEDLTVKIIRSATGNIRESDVMLAVASSAIIIGFNVEVDPPARRLVEADGVDVRLYNVIYRLIDDIDKALKGLLEPTYEDVVVGHAEVRAIFKIRRVGKVAGVYVTDGQVLRNGLARVLREGQVIHEGPLASLRRFTEDVKEVNTGFECGIGLEGFDDFTEGDVIEIYKKERVS